MSRRFQKIEGLSEIRRLPRLGKIHLGIRVAKDKKSAKCKQHPPGEMCNYCSYPKETDYFVCPDEVRREFGERPKELDIMLPVGDVNVVFQQAYEYYGAGTGLICTGNGVQAYRYSEETKAMEPRECPCEFLDNGKCSRRGHLQFLLPKVSMGGVYQIDTSSYNSIVDLNSYIDGYLHSLVGRAAMIPLKLKRVATDITHEGKKRTHYPMRIEIDADMEQIENLRRNQDMRMIPDFRIAAPKLESTSFDIGEPAVADEEHEGRETIIDAMPEEQPAHRPEFWQQKMTEWKESVDDIMRASEVGVMIHRLAALELDIVKHKKDIPEEKLAGFRAMCGDIREVIKERRQKPTTTGGSDEDARPEV